MESSKQIIRRTIAIEKRALAPIAIVSEEEINSLLDEYKSLYPATWKSWHAKWIKSNGIDTYRQLASMASQEGKNPARYFSWLLKNHG